jgi:hypothetical protein
VKGSYQVGDRVERFSCGAGPAGWRYAAVRDDGDTVELVLDEAGRLVRLTAEHDGWLVRGGVLGEEVLWVRGADEHRARAVGFTGTSPSYDVAVARALGLGVGDSRRVTLVELTEPVGAARTVEHGWARTAGPEDGVDRYEVADLQTGERWVLHLAGEVLVSREGRHPAHLLTLTR